MLPLVKVLEYTLAHATKKGDLVKKTYRRKILFLASDPTDITRLRLGEEQREIQEKLQLAKFRNKFEFHSRTSVRPVDISQILLNLEPHLIHFSGHGINNGGLCFENLEGKAQVVKPEALASLFELVAENIECVVLNACYSEIQATAIVQHINYVIGMSQAIGDKAAIAFAVGFYQALGSGHNIEQAYRFGCTQIMLQGIPEHLTPILKKNLQLTSKKFDIDKQETGKIKVDSSDGAKKKLSNKPKFFYYISIQKIEMLTTQLEVSSPILDSKALVSNTLYLIDTLKSNHNVVSLSNNIKTLETTKYIEDSGIWYQGLYSFSATGEEIVTYLSWKAFDSVFILLVGSPNNILGEKIVRDGVFVPGTSGALLRVLEFINKVIKTDEPRAVALRELPLYGSFGEDGKNTYTLAENVVELSNSKIEASIPIDEKNRKSYLSRLEEFCLNYISHLPPTRVETIFKIFSVFHCDHRTIFVGSPLYIAID